VLTYSGSPNTATFNGQALDIVPPEGYSSWKTTQSNSTFTAWGFAYSTPQDLSRFSTGELRFWLYANDGNIQVEIKNPSGDVLSKNLETDFGWTPALANTWVQYRIPLSAASSLTQVQNPFLFTQLSNACTFYIDDVRYVDSSVSSPYFSASLFNRSNNSSATTITWSTANAGSGWTLADQYLQVAVDPNTTSWGVQIYTNNKNSSPAYTGAVNSTTPAGGLVNTSNTNTVLPMAWETVSAASPTLTAQDPSSCPGNGFGCLWLNMQDKAVFTQGNPNVFNGAAYVATNSNFGIHYSQGNVFNDPSEFGAANPPTDIYLEANFGPAIGGLNYQTTTLTVEFYTP
jgi:hypothetical protein